MQQILPENVRSALFAIIEYLWNDELANYLETSPREGREEHIFLALKTVRRWLKHQPIPSPSALSLPLSNEDGKCPP